MTTFSGAHGGFLRLSLPQSAVFHRENVPLTIMRRLCGAALPKARLQQRDSNSGTHAAEDWLTELQPGKTGAARRTALKPPSVSSLSSTDLTDTDPGSSSSPFDVESSNNPVTALSSKWEGLPGQYKAVFATSLAFVICNMDKVNISVAIIPMADDFGWSPTITGLVQSSFFYGYLISQIPGGYIASRLGGRTVLPAGVFVWSAATAGVPLLASTVLGLCISRAAVGLGEGVAPSSATDIVARIIDPKERSRAISFIFGGLHVGSLVGLIIAPAVISNLGWPAVFYLFGGLGLGWSLWWERLFAGITLKEPELLRKLSSADEEEKTGQSGTSAAVAVNEDQEAVDHSLSGHSGHGGLISHTQPVPWRAFLRSRPVQALAYTHFCNNWFHYTMLAWLPTYFTDTLSLDLMKAAQVSILPPTAAIIVSAIAGPTADSLIEQGYDVSLVRKAAQCMAFLGPAVCLLAACSTDNGPATVALITLSLGLASFSLAGLYCNHADLSPKYAPVLLGLTNTSGAIPGIMGVAFTGWLYDSTSSWTYSLFLPSIFFFVTGSLAFSLYGSADRQDFSNNQPFGFEGWFRNAFKVE